MRNLTVKREKTFVGCAAKIKLCIEDHETGDVVINGVPCRRIGTLKNGEEKTFEIGEGAARVYAIADGLSKNFCNDFYPIPAGTEDVSLSGKTQFNPANGNAFRFNGVSTEEQVANRQRGTRKGFVILAIAAVIGFVVGLAFGLGLFDGSEEQVFSAEGMSITLTDDFRETSYESFTACYESRKIAVFALKESFSLMTGLEDYTLRQYAELVAKNNGIAKSDLKTDGDLIYFVRDAVNVDGVEYHYISYLYRGPDAFWLIQFATKEKDIGEYRDDIHTYARSVVFE